MKLLLFVLGTLQALLLTPLRAGTIEGTVVNTSSGTAVPCQVQVVVQVQVNGEFVLYREEISDEDGRFRIAGLPLGEEHLYLIGANRHGIFYPGPRIRLTGLQPVAHAQLAVCDAVTKPSPLMLKKMDVTIRPEPGLLKVTESLLIDNPSHQCFVGEAPAKDADPITLALAIPPEFERMTFEREFFGRRFAVFNNRVVTGIAWTPGEREVKYTYVIRNTQDTTTWQRPLDLPCTDVTIRIEGKSANEVRCDLLDRLQADANVVVYSSAGREIPAGRLLKVELGQLPLPWMSYSKWAAVAILILLIAGTSWLHFARRRRTAIGEKLREPPKSERKKRAA